MSPRTARAAALRLRGSRRGSFGRYSAAARGVTPTPEALAVVRAYVLDAASGITTFPANPADISAFTVGLVDLEASIPGHKWGKLDRMRDVVNHYNVDVAVRGAYGYDHPTGGHE